MVSAGKSEQVYRDVEVIKTCKKLTSNIMGRIGSIVKDKAPRIDAFVLGKAVQIRDIGQ